MTAPDFPEPGTCPVCERQGGRVLDSRHHESEIRRRRICEACGCRWASSERTTHIVRQTGETPSVDAGPAALDTAPRQC